MGHQWFIGKQHTNIPNSSHCIFQCTVTHQVVYEENTSTVMYLSFSGLGSHMPIML